MEAPTFYEDRLFWLAHPNRVRAWLERKHGEVQCNNINIFHSLFHCYIEKKSVTCLPLCIPAPTDFLCCCCCRRCCTIHHIYLLFRSATVFIFFLHRVFLSFLYLFFSPTDRLLFLLVRTMSVIDGIRHHIPDTLSVGQEHDESIKAHPPPTVGCGTVRAQINKPLEWCRIHLPIHHDFL
jgi:hypothetical protein